MTSVHKQILMNQIGKQYHICEDVMTNIKGFVFYDKDTYVKIMRIKSFKTQINNLIDKVLLFYNCKYLQNNKYSHWGVVISTDNADTNYINNDMCNYCGNYCRFYVDDEVNRNLPDKIICKCDT